MLFIRNIYLAHVNERESWRFRLAGVFLSELWKPVHENYKDSLVKPLFPRDSFVIRCVNCIAILLTFGVVFPLLAVVIGLDMVVNIFILRLSISHILAQIRDNEQLTVCYRDKLNSQCEHVFEVMYRALWIVVLLAAVFYSLFLFDIIGDVTGWRGALWAPLTMSFTALFVYIVFDCDVVEFADWFVSVVCCKHSIVESNAADATHMGTESGGLSDDDWFRPSSMFEIESSPHVAAVFNPVLPVKML
jgi:hypothetical protein